MPIDHAPGWPASPRLPAAISLAVMLLIALSVALPATLSVRAAPPVCNGSELLCSRRYDQVVYPATHNAMAAAEDGFAGPSQTVGIRRQLEDGIRMLLIDAHHWETPAEIARLKARLTPADQVRFEAQLRVPATPPPGVFLCHVFCGLGSTPLSVALAEIHAFLLSHPHEVLSLFIEDHVPAAEIEGAFRAAGLLPLLYSPEPEAPWPTLGEMIAANRRLVVFSEHSGGTPAWFQPGWTVVQDTRYDVSKETDFTCGINRGTPDASLFLLNHWIAKGRPSVEDSERVNKYDYLLARARACETERGRLPNFIAVNDYRRGALFAVVDTLNGIS